MILKNTRQQGRQCTENRSDNATAFHVAYEAVVPSQSFGMPLIKRPIKRPRVVKPVLVVLDCRKNLFLLALSNSQKRGLTVMDAVMDGTNAQYAGRSGMEKYGSGKYGSGKYGNGKYAADHCVICLDDFSQKLDHKSSALACGHAFGRSCLIRWAERDSHCPMCRQYFSPTSDDSFVTVLKNEFCKYLGERKIELLMPFVTTFFFEPTLNNLAIANATTVVGIGIIGQVTVRSMAAAERLIAAHFGGTPTIPQPSLRETLATCVINCSAIIAGFTCAKLGFNFRES